jgi:hypothetical protein
LQNFKWVFSIGVWFHLWKSLLIQVNAPHISELYRRMGDIMLSKILIASFGFKLEKSTFFFIANRTCIACSAKMKTPLVYIEEMLTNIYVASSRVCRCLHNV